MARRELVVKASLLALVAAFLGALLRPGDNAAPRPGQLVPDFDLAGDDGARMRLSDFRGKIVVVNFWATWCPPCVEEMPSLDRFQRTLAGRVQVLGISVDDDENAYRKFVAQHNLQLKTARDPSKKVSALYGTFKYPESYVADRDGRLVQKIVGPEDWTGPRIAALFQDLLAR